MELEPWITSKTSHLVLQVEFVFSEYCYNWYLDYEAAPKKSTTIKWCIRSTLHPKYRAEWCFFGWMHLRLLTQMPAAHGPSWCGPLPVNAQGRAGEARFHMLSNSRVPSLKKTSLSLNQRFFWAPFRLTLQRTPETRLAFPTMWNPSVWIASPELTLQSNSTVRTKQEKQADHWTRTKSSETKPQTN